MTREEQLDRMADQHYHDWINNDSEHISEYDCAVWYVIYAKKDSLVWC